jgi:hypothetical protein
MQCLYPAVLLAALVAVACDQPPTKEIAAAEAAIAAAEKQGAAVYCAERFAAAQTVLAEAQSRIQQRDYHGALSAANEAAEKARSAAKTAETAKKLARSAAELARDEARIVLDELTTLKTEAADARVPEEAFAGVEAELAAEQALIASVDEALAKQDFRGAQALGEEARAKAQALPDKYRQARSDWDAAHPKKPKAKAAKPSRKR